MQLERVKIGPAARNAQNGRQGLRPIALAIALPGRVPTPRGSGRLHDQGDTGRDPAETGQEKTPRPASDGVEAASDPAATVEALEVSTLIRSWRMVGWSAFAP